MKINKDNIPAEDKELALSIINSIRNNNRCIGNPARALQITLSELEEKKNDVDLNPTTWLLKNRELEEQIAKIKAGIEGEKQLAEFLERLLKYDDKLKDLVAFASLSQELNNNDRDYIPDSDFMIVYNDRFLIVDAKNISTNPDVPIMLDGTCILTDAERPKLLLEGVHSSINVWSDYFNKNNIKYSSIDNIICIVNKSGANITRSINTDNQLIHIATLHQFLLGWIEMQVGSGIVQLRDLTQIAKCQVRKEHSGLDLADIRRKFGV